MIKKKGISVNKHFYQILSCVFAFLIFGSVSAKELTNRLGVGYQNQFSIDLPGISARYYPNPELGVSAALGIDTESNASKFGLMVKAFRVIFKEPNLNFYLGAGAALISQETAGVSNSGFELNGFVGVEFFLPGLESLAFITEAGIGIASINDGVRFRTFGDHPFRAGIIFYF